MTADPVAVVAEALRTAYYAKSWGPFDADELAGPAVAALIDAGHLPAQGLAVPLPGEET